MSLDQNLFTLNVTPNKNDPNVVDLIDPSGTIHYRKQRMPGSVYKVEVYDPMSESLLATATAPASTSKHKTLELYNPSTVVELKYTGTLSFRWSFKWEEHEFEWKREECYMIRKPDPPVLVVVTKEPPGRLKTTAIQILDYNLNRFDIDDRKGLEIVMLTALLTFQDANETYHTPSTEANAPSSTSTSPLNTLASLGMGRKTSGDITTRKGSASSTSDASPPLPPPRPAPKAGVDRIAEMQAIRGQFNEITVEDEGSVEDYAQYCWTLLQDDAMLFVTLRSSAPDQVPKVLQVVEQTKRIRHKAGLSDDHELNQYVLYDTEKPKRIVLDDSKGKAYKPPESLTIHLSKIPMPELQPKATTSEPHHANNAKQSKEFKKEEEKARKKEEKLRKAGSPPAAPIPKSSHLHVQAHQVHPYQPSPSPSQLNNPSIYVAPPPRRPSPRPPPHPQSSPPFPSLSPSPRPASNAYASGAGSSHRVDGPNAYYAAVDPASTGWTPPPGPPPDQQGKSRPLSGIFDMFNHKR